MRFREPAKDLISSLPPIDDARQFVMLHFFDLLEEWLDQMKELLKPRLLPKILKMLFSRSPLDAEYESIPLLDAVCKFVS